MFNRIPEKYKAIILRSLVVGGVVLGGFVILNYQYLAKQAFFIVGGNQPAAHTNIPTPKMMEPNTLLIPSLNITAPIRYVDEANEDVFQKALQDGVVHYPGTADIGQLGNPYIFGHSSDMALAPGSYKTVFALLPRIENGAEIIISGKDGVAYTYVVSKQFVAEKTDVHLLDQGEYKEKKITLQTSYPLGTALRRYIVEGLLKE